MTSSAAPGCCGTSISANTASTLPSSLPNRPLRFSSRKIHVRSAPRNPNLTDSARPIQGGRASHSGQLRCCGRYLRGDKLHQVVFWSTARRSSQPFRTRELLTNHPVNPADCFWLASPKPRVVVEPTAKFGDFHANSGSLRNPCTLKLVDGANSCQVRNYRFGQEFCGMLLYDVACRNDG
jgi:hypothetical protein